MMLAETQVEIVCAGVLFDMDGVLLDSTPAVGRVWRAWAGERGLDPVEVVGRAHGRPSLATVREYVPEGEWEAVNREIERREIAAVEGIVPLPGARELLEALPEERWAIVTSCTLPLAEARIEAGGMPRPRTLVTADDIQRGKPAPDPYLAGARRLGLEARECLVIEDVAVGVEAGQAAGARVVGLTTTVGAEELLAAGAEWTARNCAALRVMAVDGKWMRLALAPRER